MKLLTAVLVLWVGAHFTASVTSSETCTTGRETHYIECDNVSRESIFNGTHPLTQYDHFLIENSDIDPLGTKEWSALSHAVEIDIEETDLKDLPAVGFKNFPCLRSLIITNSLIEVIPRGTFPNTIDATDSHCSNDGSTTESRLDFLVLGNNRIHTIEDNSLMAASLKTLYLYNNNIKDIGGKFKFLSGLQTLSLHGNNIERLERSSLQGLINLEYLDLADNAITHISDDAFYHTKHLGSIDLDNNRITFLGWITRKSTDVNFPSTRNTTESRKSTDVNFPSTPDTTESSKSTDVNFPSIPDDSPRSQKTATTAIVIIVTLLVVCVVCAVTVFVLWRRKKKQGKEEIASQPTPGTDARYSSTGGVALALGLRDA
ncbi:leucine-rich repeat-containing protein 70 [Elysia marginata]|uniref:Leucine-rich repeat-containing protein 70 n=1 Tax=Elysia marginata TaxID=1093978 RepID=A0AAV4EIM0_9GAST|nr:leucine-rich repeat-containing protein 70 [Elysia marginata]